MAKKKKNATSSRPLAVRIFAIALAVLVTGSVVTYMAWFVLNLFS